MNRLDRLKKEMEQIKSMHCLALDVKEQAMKYYAHEIECIEVYGSPNPKYEAEPVKPKIYKAKLKNKDYEVKGVYYSFPETTFCFEGDYERNSVKTRHVIITHGMTDWGLPNELRVFEIDPDTLEEESNE